jgi:hypothetical protein
VTRIEAMILTTPLDSENNYIPSAKMWSFKKLSRSVNAVSGVMIVYGFVLGERINRVMQEEILSVYTPHNKKNIRSRFESGVTGRINNTHRIHLTSFPLLL